MAATRLIALHINKGKTVAQCLRDRTDYAQNPEKTAKGDLVTGYQCDPMTVDEEFLLAKRQYQHRTGAPKTAKPRPCCRCCWKARFTGRTSPFLAWMSLGWMTALPKSS